VALRGKRKLGQYRIQRRLADGGFATVYQAYDTIEGVRVALKIPHARLVDRSTLEQFRREARVNAQLDHPNVLPLKYAGFVDGQFVIVYPLGVESLEQRLGRRYSLARAMDWAGQMLEAVAFAHGRRILHSDIKPENFILFPDGRLKLCDFGLAKVSYRTLSASGSGTVGYLAPEQALGKPSLRSDVFSLGLVLYRLFAGALPVWPFDWPLPGYDRLQKVLHPDLSRLILKAVEVDHRSRYRDAVQMRTAFRRIRSKGLRPTARARRRRPKTARPASWKRVRFREFQARYRSLLETRSSCGRCGGPLSEPMQHCPWCGAPAGRAARPTAFPARCPRCKRGRKLDWRYCPWCYGPAFRDVASRSYSDRRYTKRCANRSCPDRRLMPFMRYCPWCRRKTTQSWKIEGSRDSCPRCNWGVLPEFWEHCPWCGRGLRKR
jgi:serine/threonine-protein kinase